MDKPEGIKGTMCSFIVCNGGLTQDGGPDCLNCVEGNIETVTFTLPDLDLLKEACREEGAQSMDAAIGEAIEQVAKSDMLARQHMERIAQLEASVEAVKLDRDAILSQHQENNAAWERQRNQLEADLAAASKMFDEVENKLADACQREAAAQKRVEELERVVRILRDGEFMLFTDETLVQCRECEMISDVALIDLRRIKEVGHAPDCVRKVSK